MKKKHKYKKFIFIVIFFFLASSVLSAQSKIREKRKINSIFNKIERGINSSSASGISEYFNSRVFVSLPNNKKNYFSSNQLFYLLQDYFSSRHIMYFSFDKVSVDGPNPFGYGNIKYEHLGMRGNSTVYVSLSKIGANWRITKFVVN